MTNPSLGRLLFSSGLAVLTLCQVPRNAQAQYFGQNKVVYDSFKFHVLQTPHFDVYFYDAERPVAPMAGRIAERWYARLSKFFSHQLSSRQPLIIYASAPQFQETNAIQGELGEGTGGVTEALRRRIVLPAAGPLKDLNHVIGHELVHAFQYDITGGARQGGVSGIPGAAALPLWFIEGMAEYLSLGPVDPLTAMWMRDAALTKLPTIGNLNDPRYFPYRYGQALLAYIGGTYGDEVLVSMLRTGAQRRDLSDAIQAVLHIDPKELSKRWHSAIHQAYDPLTASTRPLSEQAKPVIQARGPMEGDYYLAPALSPDGAQVIFFSDRNLFSIDLFLADARTGRVKKRLTRSDRDQHFQSLEFINSAGVWDHSGHRFAFTAVSAAKPVLTIYDVDRGRIEREIKLPRLAEIYNPTWSPDGKQIAFSGLSGGFLDIYSYDLTGDSLRQLTRDPYSDLQPSWSPDGRTIAFSTDRFGSSLPGLRFGPNQLAFLDPVTGRIRKAIPGTDGVVSVGKQINAQWSPDGAFLYFLADPDGITNVYRLQLTSGTIDRTTNTYTGVSGITDLSPALSVAAGSGAIMFSAYKRGGYGLYRIDSAPSVAVGAEPSGGVGEQGTAPSVRPGAGGSPRRSPQSPVLPDVQTATHLMVPPPVSPTSSPSPSTATPAVPELPTGVPLIALSVPPAILPPQDRPVSGYLPLLYDPNIGLLPPDTPFPVKPYKAKLSLEYVAQPTIGAAFGAFGTYVGGGTALYFSDLLGNHNLVTVLSVNGSFKDFNGGVGYQNLSHRLNWGASLQQQVYGIGSFATGFTVINGDTVLADQTLIQRQTERDLSLDLAYPFNRAQRLEFSTGLTTVGFSNQLITDVFDPLTGIFLTETKRDLAAPSTLKFARASMALVYDNAIQGAVAPITGERYRLEVTPYVGSLNMVNGLVDFRRYFLPVRRFTVAARVLHFGRYGRDSDDPRLSPLFLGYDGLVRGYTYGSFSASECVPPPNNPNACPAFDQLLGSRILVGNFELRIPLFGALGLGSGYYGAFPLEVGGFYDAGVAWNRSSKPELFGGQRNLVRSAGFMGRLNLLGYAIIEVDLVHPYDRPQKNWIWQFSLVPGF
jgi:WD40 repeat protein